MSCTFVWERSWEPGDTGLIVSFLNPQKIDNFNLNFLFFFTKNLKVEQRWYQITPTRSEPKHWVDIVIVPAVIASQQASASIQDIVCVFFPYACSFPALLILHWSKRRLFRWDLTSSRHSLCVCVCVYSRTFITLRTRSSSRHDRTWRPFLCGAGLFFSRVALFSGCCGCVPGMLARCVTPTGDIRCV